MDKTENTPNILHRITLAWAISECALGGFLHAIQSPFTGLLVGGLSVMFISLLAFHAEKPTRAILQALVFVLGVKMAVSPHSPLGAYFAVSLQALFGVLFFKLIPRFSIAAVLVGVTSLIASAIQKVIILTILFGTGFWNAIDSFSQEIATSLSFLSIQGGFSFSEWLIGIYLGVYALGGFLIGWLASRIPHIMEKRATEFDRLIENFDAPSSSDSAIDQPKRKFQIWPLVVAFILLGMAVQWLLFSADSAFQQMMRTLTVIAVWMLILRPIFKWILRKSLKSKQASIQSEIEQVQTSIPTLVSFAKFAWKTCGNSDGNRLIGFITIYVYYAIYRL
jgi:hypothetical protein